MRIDPSLIYCWRNYLLSNQKAHLMQYRVWLCNCFSCAFLFRCVEVFYIYFHAGRVEEPYVSITKKRQMPKDGHSEELEKEVGQAEGKLFTHRSAFSRASVIQAFLGSAPQLTLQMYICILQQEITVARSMYNLGI